MIRGASLALALSACGSAGAPGAPTQAAPVPAEPSTAESAPSAPVASAAAPVATETSAPAAPVASVPATPRPPAVSTKKSARCKNDDDCALATSHDCCGSCPVVPITAISAAAAAAAQKKEVAHCAREDHDCSAFRCPALPVGCQLRALCRQGWCEPALSKACEG
ncbi:MAG: hypothetical protein HYZ29_31185 [Myxococcales bacterium]|nr:hypothetical protein [Myxococcales bacterium]